MAPGLFSANASGSDPAAAVYLQVAADSTRTSRLTFDPNTLALVPMEVATEGDQVYLWLYGTGISGYQTAVTATAGGVSVPVAGVAPQGQFVGLDRVNIGPLPSALAGSGAANIVLTVDGSDTNPVTVSIM